MEAFNNHALRRTCFNYYNYTFKRRNIACRNILFYWNQDYNLSFVKFIDLALQKRRLYTVINSYYSKFITKLKNEIKNDQLLQDDIQILKKKFYDIQLNFCYRLSLRNFYFSNTLLNFAKLQNMKFFSQINCLTLKFYLIFSNLIMNDFFLKQLTMAKNLFDDETNRNQIERKLSNWESARNRNSNVNKINTKDQKLRNLKIESDTKFPGYGYSVVPFNYSLWYRISEKLKVFRWLKNIFESNYLGKTINGNTISRAVKEMKILDPDFKLNDFISIFEAYILPKFMDSYLACDERKLRLHCGDTAYRQLNSNIVELKKMGLNLNTKILQLGDIELRGVESNEVTFSFNNGIIQKSQPVFIFTFKTQQIISLQDSNGRIISGSSDDIRELQYSISVTPHLNIKVQGLEFPYLITELTVTSSVPIF